MGEQVWFITGASRGMGVEFAGAASTPDTASSPRAEMPLRPQRR